MTVGEPGPKSLRSLVDFGLVMEGFVMDFLAGVSAGVGVVVAGDMGRLRFLDRLAGCSDGEGTSLATIMSTFIVSESEDRLELLPKMGRV